MRRLLLLATILIVGAAVVRQLIPAERRAEFRQRLAHLPEECECPCHGSEAEEAEPTEQAAEEEKAEAAATA